MDNISSLIFYLVLFGISILCFYRSSKLKNNFIARVYTIIGLSIPVLIATLRYQVGVDYPSYVQSAIELSRVSFPDFLIGNASYFEPTMYLISKFTFAGHNHAALFFGVYAAITSIFFYLAAKRFSVNHWWIIMALYLLVSFSPSLNTVRQFASIAITFFASTYIIKSKEQSWKKFSIYMVIAFLFHSSAVIAAVLLPLLRYVSRHDNRKTRIVLLVRNIVIASLVYLLLYSFVYLIPEISFLEKYATFIQDAGVLANHPPNPIVKVAPILVSFIFFKKLNKLDLNFTYYYSILFVALALSLIGDFIPQGYRLADYFTAYYFIVFASLLDVSKRYKIIFIPMILIYGIIYFTYSTFINNSYMTFPYQFILGALL